MNHSTLSALAVTYHVEVSGWDTSQSFFVEKAELEWLDGGAKRLTLDREVRVGSILFLRLLQPVSPDPSHPVPYAIERAERTVEDQWHLRLKQVEPRPSRSQEARD